MKYISLILFALLAITAQAQLGEVQVVQVDSTIYLLQEQATKVTLSSSHLTHKTDTTMTFVVRDTSAVPVSLETIDQQLEQIDAQLNRLMSERQQYAVIRKRIVEIQSKQE